MEKPIIRDMSGKPIMIDGQPVHYDSAGRLVGIGNKPVHRDGRGKPVLLGGQPVQYYPNIHTSDDVGGLPVVLNWAGEPSRITGVAPGPTTPPWSLLDAQVISTTDPTVEARRRPDTDRAVDSQDPITTTESVAIRPIIVTPPFPKSEPDISAHVTDRASESALADDRPTETNEHRRVPPPPDRRPLVMGTVLLVSVVALITTLVSVHVRNSPIGTAIPTVVEPEEIAVAPDGGRLYVVNAGSSVSVIDAKMHTIVSQIPGDHYQITISSDGRRLYYIAGGEVRVIDLFSDKVSTAIPKIRNALAIALSPDSSKLYVCEQLRDARFKAVDLADNILIADLPISGSIGRLAVTPDGRHVYASSSVTGGMIYAIEPSSNKVVAEIPVPTVMAPFGPEPINGIQITPDGQYAYVDGPNIWVIDISKNAIVQTLPFQYPSVLSQDGRHLYAFSDSALGRLDAATGRVLGSIADNIPASDIAITQDGRTLYVANDVEGYEDKSISVVDTSTFE